MGAHLPHTKLFKRQKPRLIINEIELTEFWHSYGHKYFNGTT
jgi:hypothetical protein